MRIEQGPGRAASRPLGAGSWSGGKSAWLRPVFLQRLGRRCAAGWARRLN